MAALARGSAPGQGNGPLPSADVRLDLRLAECSICYESYQGPSGGQVPKMLQCRHSLCLACLRRLVCRNGALPFVACPFCRTVTVVPEAGLQALRDDEALLQQEVAPQGWAGAEEAAEEPGEDQDASRDSSHSCSLGDLTLSLGADFNYRTGSIFTVSSLVSAYPAGLYPGLGFWGTFHLQEVHNTRLVELPSRACFRGSPTPPSVENLRLCFAVTLILLIVSVFFALVFFK